MNNNYDNTKKLIFIGLGVLTGCVILVGLVINTVKLFNIGLFGIKNISGLGKVVEDTVELNGDLSELSVNLSLAELKISNGDVISVSYRLPEKLVPEIELKNGILEITNKNAKANGIGSLKDLSSDGYKITVTIPANVELNFIDMKVDCGNVELEDRTFERLDASVDCGNIEFKNIEADTINLEADLGNADLSDISCKSMTIQVDCGNIEVADSNFDNVSADNNMGNIELKDVTFKSGKFDNDMGNIEVDGDFDAISAECSMGSIAVDTVRPESEVKLYLDVDMGDIKVNGKKWNK